MYIDIDTIDFCIFNESQSSMKKFYISIIALSLLMSSPTVYARNEVKFIYINGTNNNTKKMEDWYFKSVQKLHPYMCKKFQNSCYVQKYLLEGNTYKISEEPIAFFWGDKSKAGINRLNEGLSLTKVFSPKPAQTARKLLAHCMHDAIWVQKYRNMAPIINDLQKVILEENEKGNKVVLFGYSAGTFVSYEYLFNKMKYINLEDFISKSGLSQEEQEFVRNNRKKNTCIDAIVASKIAVLNMNGHLIPNINTEMFKENYLKLDSYTDSVCVPDNEVKGVINYASPLVLFYSDLADPAFEFSYYNKLLYKNVIEKNMFFLTVNYADDPLGFPATKNLPLEELEKAINLEINPKDGFIYDKSNRNSRRTFIGAHTAYLKSPKRFSKVALEAYVEGKQFNNKKSK